MSSLHASIWLRVGDERQYAHPLKIGSTSLVEHGSSKSTVPRCFSTSVVDRGRIDESRSACDGVFRLDSIEPLADMPDRL
jgi:hypothetical protein